MKYKKALFIFRRDLRLEDNTGLIFALKNSEKVIPAFIFTPEQIERNPYRSDHCLKFMLESIEDLEEQLKQKGGKLFLFHGKNEAVVEECIEKLHVDAVIVNRDYTPYSIARDAKIEKVCKKAGVPFLSFDDALLHPPEETVKKDGKPYTIFTPYFRNAHKLEVPPPVHNRGTNYFHGSIPFNKGKLPQVDVNNGLRGGRSEAVKILKKLDQLEDYDQLRDFPAEDFTSHLSAYLKFTVISPREVYAAISAKLGPHHPLIRSLYWRDFFSSIALFFPHVFESAFHSKFDKLKWHYDTKIFKKWCNGQTGFPIVDAGMRELNATGQMHNRVRMIVASFLVKDLHIDWHLGERYFAQTLIDYDPAVNNGNWQWIASTGCDAQPYFRVFNPWTQQKKFDPDCVYIKKWIPELAEFSPKIIHEWAEQWVRGKYPEPIVEHEVEAKIALANYKKAAH